MHEERRDGEDGIFEEEVDEEGGPNAVKCLVLIAVLTMMLTWYSVHTAISGPPPSLHLLPQKKLFCNWVVRGVAFLSA